MSAPLRDIIKRTTRYLDDGRVLVSQRLSCGHTATARPEYAYKHKRRRCTKCEHQIAEEARSNQLISIVGIRPSSEFK